MDLGTDPHAQFSTCRKGLSKHSPLRNTERTGLKGSELHATKALTNVLGEAGCAQTEE